jgi:magnesium transporter
LACPVSIRALLSQADGNDRAVDVGEWKPRVIGKDELLWIDVEGDEDVEPVRRALRPSKEVTERLRDGAGSSIARVLDGSIEVVVPALGDEVDGPAVPLRIVAGDGWIVTQHPRPLAFIDRHRELIQDQREVGRLAPLEFVASILDWHVAEVFRAAEDLEGEVDRLDDAALRTDRDLLDRMVALRRRIARVRRLLTPNRDVVAELSRPDFVTGAEVEADEFASVARRLERAAEAVNNAREMLIGTFDVHMTRMAQRTNDTMRVLTLASVILLPSVVLAGIMGMNFRVPIFDEPNLFWVVIAAMILMAVATLLVARLRGWL